MKGLLLIFNIIFSTIIFAQVHPNGRIDYSKFDESLFDSIMLNELNIRRSEMKLSQFTFDSICFLSAKYQSKVMAHQKSLQQIHNVNLEGVVLSTPEDRFEYFNHVSQILDIDKKDFYSECYTGLIININSRTFTYEKLAKFIFDDFFITSDITDKIFYYDYNEYNNRNLFSAFAVTVELDESGDFYALFITNVVAMK